VADDENDNVQLGNHARMLRTFVDLPGGPTILVTCHPAKNPDMTNLVPRGGGAFLNEVDGNLVALKEKGAMVTEITWHGKWRGPDFSPFPFQLVTANSEKLVDSKGRKIWTVYAKSISNEEQDHIEQLGRSNQDELLRAMLEHPGLSLNELAKELGWKTVDGRVNKRRVQIDMDVLKKNKLVEQRRDGHYVLTKKGQEEAEKIPARVSSKPKTEAKTHKIQISDDPKKNRPRPRNQVAGPSRNPKNGDVTLGGSRCKSRG
jgi:antitoxin component HigA of HigAB toxin-antitoxin module